MARTLKYTGKKRPKAGIKDPINGGVLYPYIPSSELVDVVNLAIHLKRPLLLEGESGGGKTQLARAVAYELDLDYKFYSVKSTSKAQELLYTFDTIGRLRDAQLAATEKIASPKEIKEIIQTTKYCQLGVLGEAFKSQETTVVLIDEIDKADVDFPNDLLQELEERRFYIPETKEYIPDKDGRGNTPIIFITSNSQKKLSNAFLRRCLYYSLKFPNKNLLLDIVKERFNNETLSVNLLERAVKKFIQLRESMEFDQEERESTKKVSTSEWIDWVDLMRTFPKQFEEKLEADEIPFPEVLLKSYDDRQRYLEEN